MKIKEAQRIVELYTCLKSIELFQQKIDIANEVWIGRPGGDALIKCTELFSKRRKATFSPHDFDIKLSTENIELKIAVSKMTERYLRRIRKLILMHTKEIYEDIEKME